MRRIEDRIAEVMTAENDKSWRGPIRRSYLICSSPQVGGNILSQSLTHVGAGAPFEYLHGAAIDAYRFRYDGATLNWVDYLAFLRTKRSPEGIFGLKAHFHQVAGIHPDWRARTDMLNSFDRLILLEREDKLLQAIAAYRAQRSEMCFADGPEHADGGRKTAAKYDAGAIARNLAFVLEEAAAWNSALHHVHQPVLRLTYESFVADLPRALTRIMDFLTLPPQGLAPDVDPAVCIADACNVKWRERFAREVLSAS